MDVRKIIKRVLSEADEQKPGEGYTDFIGRPLPSVFGGEGITNVTTIGNMTYSFDKINADQYSNYCNKHIKNNTSKFYGITLKECLDIHKKMIFDVQNLGAPNGVMSFTWKGQTFKACLKRDKQKETLRFSGYYGSIDSESYNCYAPEWFYMVQEDKKKNDKGGTGTRNSSKEMTIAGPDFK